MGLKVLNFFSVSKAYSKIATEVTTLLTVYSDGIELKIVKRTLKGNNILPNQLWRKYQFISCFKNCSHYSFRCDVSLSFPVLAP